MKGKLLSGLVACFFVFSMVGLVKAEEVVYFPTPEEYTPSNVPEETFYFEFESLVPPSNIFVEPPGLYQLKGGTLFIEHQGGHYALQNQSIGVYIDDVFFGAHFIGPHPQPYTAGMVGIPLDWHQINSIVSDGAATVRVVNSPYVGTGVTPLSGTLSAWLVYDGIDTGIKNQGCTPGYWKNHSEDWAATGYSPEDDFDLTFGTDFFDPDITLGEAIGLGGGGYNKLARHGTAALLNAAHPNVNSSLSEAEVIQAVTDGKSEDLVDANELGCPLPFEQISLTGINLLLTR